MHRTAYEHGRQFFELYWRPEFSKIIELGSQDVNGTLRDHCPAGATYIGIDMEPGKGVDLVVSAGEPLPMAADTVDVAVTSSAFEHDVCFWETFLELVRVLKPGGLLYVNAPSNHAFHRYPVDCWRFYPDAGHALALWATRRGMEVELAESFVAAPEAEGWADFIAVFRKAGGQPLQRKGRIADHAAAANIHDITLDPMAVEKESSATWDMLAQADLAEQLERDEGALAAARAEAAEIRAAIDRLEQRLTEIDTARARAEGELARTEGQLGLVQGELAHANGELARIKGSTAWRFLAPALRWLG